MCVLILKVSFRRLALNSDAFSVSLSLMSFRIRFRIISFQGIIWLLGLEVNVSAQTISSACKNALAKTTFGEHSVQFSKHHPVLSGEYCSVDTCSVNTGR